MKIKVANLNRHDLFKLLIYFSGMSAIVKGSKKEMNEIAVKFVPELNKYMNDTLRTIVTKHLRLSLEYMTNHEFKDMLMDSGLQLLMPYVQSVKDSAGYTDEEEKELTKLKQEKENESTKRNN